jgi:uncharacterized protein YjbI with pentapeptide repeats
MAIRSVNLSDTIGELVTEFNLMGTDIGDISLLTTSDTSSIVAAIQSLDSDLRFDFGNAVDSDLIIQLITDESNLISIFDSADFEIVNGRVSIKDSDATFTSINTTDITSTNVTTTNVTTTNLDADSATITNLSSTNFNSTNSTLVNLDADSATITNLSSTNFNSTNSTLVNLDADSSSITNLTSINNTLTNITFTTMNGGNIDADSATFTGVINAQDFNSTSDICLKENIETLNNAINVLNNIRPVSFVWKENGKPAYGVIAQEVEEVLPEIVDQDKHGVKRVAYSQIIPFLVQVIQEQNKEIQNIKAVLNLE